MGNGNTGLKGQFGVGDPKSPGQDKAGAQDSGSDKQAQDFKAAFQKEQGLINGHLQYTAVNAETSRHEPLAARRDALFGAFQSALAKIDRKKPSTAQGGIDKVLGDARALSREAAAFRQQAEKAKADWDSRQAKYDEAVQQVEALEAWEDAKAPALRALLDGIRKQVNQRQYAQSTTTLDQLLPKLAPIHAEYLRQKDAKPQYEQQFAEQSERVEPLKAAERPSQPMTAKSAEVDAALEEAKGKGGTKDFVAGLDSLAKVRALVDELDALSADPQRQQYLADTQSAEAVCEPQPEPAFKTLAADWTAISEGGTQAQPLADSGDYTGANQALADVAAKRAEFQAKHDELVQQKQSYETTLAQIEPRLQGVSLSEPPYAKLQPLQQELAATQTEMESAAEAEDFAQALVKVQDLTAKVEAIEQAKAEIDQNKQAYETALAALQPRLQAVSVSDPAYTKIEAQLQEIAQAQTAMEASAQGGDYDQANTQLQDLTAKVDAYEKAKAEIDRKKDEYESLRDLVEPRIAEAAKKQYLNLAKQLEAIKKLRQDAAAAAQAGDFDAAKRSMLDASAKTDAYVAAADKEVEPPIMGSAQGERADATLKKLPEADQKEVQALMDNAKSEAEKQYLLKGVAAGHSAAELKAFAKKIEGKDEKWMRDNLSVTGSSKGTGVKQQWSMSCNATAAQAVKAQMDPIYALKLHEENPELDQADNADATAKNPKLAQEQKDMLTSNYTGARGPMSGGGAVPRSGPAAAGRWNDDLLNNNSDSTGITYAPKDVGAGMSVNDAIGKIDSGTGRGQPVPIVIGDNGANKNAHYVLVTGMGKGPPKQYTIHDPGSGQTVVRTEDDIKNGKINLSGWNHLSTIEDPSTKAVTK
jgi:hypothetical protein